VSLRRCSSSGGSDSGVHRWGEIVVVVDDDDGDVLFLKIFYFLWRFGLCVEKCGNDGRGRGGVRENSK